MLQPDSSFAMAPVYKDHIFSRPTTAAPCDHYPAYSGEHLTDTRGCPGENTLTRPISRSAIKSCIPYPTANLANMSDPYHGDVSFGATVVSPFTPSMSDSWFYPIDTEGTHTQFAIPEYTLGRPFESTLQYSGAHTLGTLDQDGQRDRIPLDSTTAPAFDVGSQDWTIDPSSAEFWASTTGFDLHPAYSTIVPPAAESCFSVARVDHGHTASVMNHDCAAQSLPCYRAPTLFTEMGYPPATASYIDETPTVQWTEHSGNDLETLAQNPIPSSNSIDTSTPAYKASQGDLLIQPTCDTSGRIVPFEGGLSATEWCGHPSLRLGFSRPSPRAIGHLDPGSVSNLDPSKVSVPLGYGHVDRGSVEHCSLVSFPTGNPTTALTNASSDRLAMPGVQEILGKKR